MTDLFGIRADDFKYIVPNLYKAFDSMNAKYQTETAPKLKLVDNMVILSLTVCLIELTYGMLYVRDPFHAFIAGTWTSLGVFGLTMGLRIQLSVKEDFGTQAIKQLLFEYMLGMMIMFFAGFLLIG